MPLALSTFRMIIGFIKVTFFYLLPFRRNIQTHCQCLDSAHSTAASSRAADWTEQKPIPAVLEDNIQDLFFAQNTLVFAST